MLLCVCVCVCVCVYSITVYSLKRLHIVLSTQVIVTIYV